MNPLLCVLLIPVIGAIIGAGLSWLLVRGGD